MRHVWITTLLLLCIEPLFSSSANARCGRVTIADTQTRSSTLIAHIDQYILTHGFGCQVELVTGSPQSIINKMITRGQPDIAPEIWLNSVKQDIEPAINEQRLFYVGEPIPEGEEGFWVPQHIVINNDVFSTIEGIKANAALFSNPQNPTRSIFYGCRPGWDCQASVKHLFKALNLQAAGFDLFNPESADNLEQIMEQAYTQKTPWFGYFHKPSAIIAKYPMFNVDFGTGTLEDAFHQCINQPQCLEPQVTMYPVSKIHTVVSSNFAYQADDILNYLRQRKFTEEQLNTMLSWMYDNKELSSEDAMYYFLIYSENDWRPWLSSYHIGKVRRALNPREIPSTVPHLDPSMRPPDE